MNYLYKTEPRDYQRRVTASALNHIYTQDQDFYNLFMWMGTGKTKTAIDIVSNLYMDYEIDAVLLIAPNGIQKQWLTDQVPEHSPVKYYPFLWNNKKSKQYIDKLGDFLGNNNYVSPEITASTEADLLKSPIHKEQTSQEGLAVRSDGRHLKWFFVNVERFSTKDKTRLKAFTEYLKYFKCAIILDEATRIKTPDSLRTKMILEIRKLAKYAFPLTGTLITNSPFDAYSICDFASSGFWGCSYFIFKHRYGMLVRDTNHITGKQYDRLMSQKDFDIVKWHIKKGNKPEEIAIYTGINVKNIQEIINNPGKNNPFKNLDDIKNKLAHCSAFVSKEEALPELPPKIFKTIEIEMNPDQVRIYNELKKTMLSEYAGQELTVQNKLTQMLRLQQITGGFFPYENITDTEITREVKPIGTQNPKLTAIIDYLEDNCAGNEKIIIWSRFVAEIKMITRELKKMFPEKRTEAYYGGVNQDERGIIQSDFAAGNIDFIVINQATGAMGLNFQISNLHFYFSNDYSIEKRLQSEDRSHRYGQKNAVIYVDLVVPETVDYLIYGALKNKMDLVNYFKSKRLKDIL